VDQKTPGVIVFLWLSIFCGFYFLVKFPRFTPAAMIMIVTQVCLPRSHSARTVHLTQ
jgi:hypothetical protein